MTARKKKTKRRPPDDGFYWEEWRGGKKVREGYHDGVTLAGQRATSRVQTRWLVWKREGLT